MKKKIILLSSGHNSEDDRIFYKFAISFNNNNFDCTIATSVEELDTTINNIKIKSFNGVKLTKIEKVNKFLEYIIDENPDFIICSEPLPILSSIKFKNNYKSTVKIIYDVTEWYPENYIMRIKGITKYLEFIKLYLFNVYCSNLSDGIIVGESGKKKRYSIFAPFIKKEIIGYYPPEVFFPSVKKQVENNVITLCYAGLLKFDRGILTLLDIAEKVSERLKEIKVIVNYLGKFENQNEEYLFKEKIKEKKNCEINFIGWLKYEDISENLTSSDICFDLRKNNYLYRNSLPIKLFEYMASGKVIIFSDIKPIHQHVGKQDFLYLIDHDDIEQAAEIVIKYATNPALLFEHSQKARDIYEEKFKWEFEEKKLIKFISRV